MRVLITGGAGFLGHHVVEHILQQTEWDVVTLDRLDTSGNLNRLADVLSDESMKRRVSVIFHDLRAAISPYVAKQIGPVDMIFHLAASTHVDRSIESPIEFVLDNVVGTCHLLDYARTLPSLHRFFYFSTDEVFGACMTGANKEWDAYHSRNPYAATKAGGEELALAYENTYRLPVVITHCMNIFGERQHPEKFIPSTIRKVLAGETVTIHADPTRTIPGSRFYIHARNVASALVFLATAGHVGEKYNIVGEQELSNLAVAQLIGQVLEKPVRTELVDFHSSRPGHDLRYALDGRVLADLGWKPPVNLVASLTRTIQWTLRHPQWQ